MWWLLFGVADRVAAPAIRARWFCQLVPHGREPRWFLGAIRSVLLVREGASGRPGEVPIPASIPSAFGEAASGSQPVVAPLPARVEGPVRVLAREAGAIDFFGAGNARARRHDASRWHGIFPRGFVSRHDPLASRAGRRAGGMPTKGWSRPLASEARSCDRVMESVGGCLDVG